MAQYLVTIQVTVYENTPEEAAKEGCKRIMDQDEPEVSVQQVFCVDLRQKD